MNQREVLSYVGQVYDYYLYVIEGIVWVDVSNCFHQLDVVLIARTLARFHDVIA